MVPPFEFGGGPSPRDRRPRPAVPRKGIAAAVVPLAAALSTLLLLATPVAAQERSDSVAVELARLRARLDSLEAVVARLRAQGGAGADQKQEEAQDALARIRAAAAAAAQAGGGGGAPDTTAQEVPEFEGRQRSLQALNPEISVTADLFGHLDVDEPERDHFVPREFELALQSSLDPYSRAKVFIGIHDVGPELAPFGEHGDGEAGDGHDEGGPDIGVEEGYVEWVGLPGGVNVKVGRFYQRFGTMNRWHSHALPFQSRSLPHLAFIGEEPLGQTGVGVSWLVPWGGAGTLETALEVTGSSNEALFGESDRASVLANLNGFWQLSEAADLDLSLSWVNGSYETGTAYFDRTLWGAEGAFTWLPPARSKYRGFVLRGGAMLLDGLASDEHEDGAGEPEAHEPGEGTALGLWSMAELRLGRQWLVGARVDRTESPTAPEETAWLVSPTLTWWQSEYVRLRVEYDALGRSWMDDGEGRLWLQVTAAMGPHKHETY